MRDVKAIIETYLDQIIEYRRHIHRNPELSQQETETAKYIAEMLRKMGLEPQTGVGGNGVVAVIEGRGKAAPGCAAKPKCIGLRADCDALPVPEATGLEFASENPGVSHACGHDMHTAMLLGAARVLNELKDEFSGSVKLIFQPSEEDVEASGARAMIADGVLENPHVDAMIGQHVMPQYELGTAAIRNGTMMASSDRILITVKGKASHGSMPEDGVDAVVIAANIITTLQTIVSRKIGAQDAAVVTIGTIHGGDRYNVIADCVKLEGTCRNLNPEVRKRMPERIRQIACGVAEAMGGSCDVEYTMGYSTTVNDPAVFELVHGVMKDSLGEKALVPTMSLLGGEDFSYFCERVPSAYFWLGTTAPGAEYVPIHNGCFCPDERAMSVGIEIMVNSALEFLAGKK